MIDKRLLELVVCPQDKGELIYRPEEEVLYNPRLRVAYPIADDIPVLLVERARPVSDDEHKRFTTA